MTVDSLLTDLLIASSPLFAVVVSETVKAESFGSKKKEQETL